VPERIEIQPAGVAQVHRSLRLGDRIVVDDDVQNIASDLRAIRATLRLEYDRAEDLWFVMDLVAKPDGSSEEKLVTVWDAEKNGGIDQRLVQRVREVAAPGYDIAAELEKADREAERERSRRFREQVGPAAEKLKWALRKDLGADKGRAFVPGATRG
jgi:hypothetical protein